MSAVMLSRASIYNGNCNCVLQNASRYDASAHLHDFFEVAIYLEESGTVQLREKEYKLTRGDIVFINIFEPHIFQHHSNGNGHYYNICIDPSLLLSFSTASSNLLDIFSPQNGNTPIFHLQEPRLHKYLAVLDEYLQEKPENGQDLFERSLLYRLLSLLYSDCFDGAHVDTVTTKHTAVAADLMGFVSGRLEESLSLEKLAKHVNYSVYYICRLFKYITGYTLTNYIVEKRIEKASCLLCTGISIPEASKRAGFHNYSYFYKAFRKIYGVSPADYRKNFTNDL